MNTKRPQSNPKLVIGMMVVVSPVFWYEAAVFEILHSCRWEGQDSRSFHIQK